MEDTGERAAAGTTWRPALVLLGYGALGAALLWLLARRWAGAADPWPDLLAAALLFHPRGLFVIEQAWGEPLALPLLALGRGVALVAFASEP